MVAHDVAKFIAGADLPTSHTLVTIETLDDSREGRDPTTPEVKSDNLPKFKDEEQSVPYHKLRLLEMVKVIHLVHKPSGGGVGVVARWQSGAAEIERYQDALTILSHIQPSRNLIPHADRMTSRQQIQTHHVPMEDLLEVDDAFRTSSFLSARAVCHGEDNVEDSFRWPTRILSDTSVCHVLHLTTYALFEWAETVIPDTRNIYWYPLPSKQELVDIGCRLSDSGRGAVLTSMVLRLYDDFIHALERLQSTSTEWPKDQHTNIEIHLNCPEDPDDLRYEARKDLQIRLEKLIKDDYEAFPGTITVKLPEPGQVCPVCEGGSCEGTFRTSDEESSDIGSEDSS